MKLSFQLQLLTKRLLNCRRSCQCSYSSQSVQERNKIFDEEVQKQKKKIGRIERIEVSYTGRPENVQLLLNRHLSTPHQAARHISEWLSRDAALALVDDEPWDMHRPLNRSCGLRLLTVSEPDPYLVNKAYWRTCSLLLGAVVSQAFRGDVPVHLHSFPSPKVSSGSFVHDASLGLSEWAPTLDELRALSADLVRLAHRALPLERLQVSPDLAADLFQHNHFKLKQIPAIAQQSEDGLITLYRVGDHIDISKGPMVANTDFVGRASVTAVHKIKSEDGDLYRFQGVSLPRGLMLNHFAYQILEDRAKKLNNNEDSYDKREKQVA